MSTTFQTSDFQIAVPDGWRHRLVTTLFEGPAAPGQFQRSIVLTQDLLLAPCTAADFAAQQRGDLLAVLPNVEVQDLPPLGTAAAPIPQLTLTWTPPDGSSIVQRQVFFVRAPWAWTFTSTTLKSDAGSLDDLFLRTVASFSPKP
ncbi:MAG: hypothetical protein U0359_37950 [Byssovorax sp.]